MKFSFRAFIIAVVCLLSLPLLAFAQPASAPVAGVYENFSIVKESGDLEGMRVVIIPAGNGFHAMVQIAQGGAEDPKPEFVPVKITGTNIEFTIGEQNIPAPSALPDCKSKTLTGQYRY